MDKKLYVLPALCLGGATLLLAPARQSQAFSKIGGSLSETQRDVRVFDNFIDATANNNVTPDSQFPGYLGAELAVWKGIVEWGSLLHGDGTGDPLSGNVLGNGAANFDAMWAGMTSAAGTTNNNIVSSVSSCGGGGTLAFTETPISDGWRIKYCDEWVWDDGPGTISSRWDIQGVMSHEFGHALGLGHSGVSTATMFPSGSPGQTSMRSIAADDIAGIQCVYGLASGTKPVITATVADSGAGTITIYGSNFGATDNEVWFTNGTVTATSVDPIVRVTGVTSGGAVITVSIPVDAGPGDVMINKSGAGGATLSNAFPTDLVGTFGTVPGPHPDVTLISPSIIDALTPGTAELVTLTGTNLDLTTSVLLDGVPVGSSRFTVLNSTTVTVDVPQASSLGAHTLSAADASSSDGLPITVVAVTAPTLEWGDGEPLNVVDRDNGVGMIVAGPVGQVQLVLGSRTGVPSFRGQAIMLPDVAASSLINPGAYVIPAKGWFGVNISEGLPVPPLIGTTWFARSYALIGPHTASNSQSITLVP